MFEKPLSPLSLFPLSSHSLHSRNLLPPPPSTDDANTLFLKLQSKPDPPPRVALHAVPVPVVPLDAALPGWDLALRRILPCIDGMSPVSSIVARSGVQTDLVKAALQHLVYWGYVRLVDRFHVSQSRG